MNACANTAASSTTCSRCASSMSSKSGMPSFSGLNLTFECREGILKHCSAQNARLLGDVGERFLNRTQPGLEAQLANLADAIAYNNHDVDDGVRAGLITVDDLRDVRVFSRVSTPRSPSDIRKSPPRRQLYETIRRMVDYLVSDLIVQSQKNIVESAGRQHRGRARAVPSADLAQRRRARGASGIEALPAHQALQSSQGQGSHG